jgi:hypothetical protein
VENSCLWAVRQFFVKQCGIISWASQEITHLQTNQNLYEDNFFGFHSSFSCEKENFKVKNGSPTE